MKQNATMAANLLVFFFIFSALLLSPISCLNPKKLPPPTNTLQGSLAEEMTRLGSTPPSCYNKCNNCHPCMAVQVPTMPSNRQLRPPALGGEKSETPATMDNFYDPLPYAHGGNSRYSNYKPLGWKCRCGGHFYNP